MKPRSAPQLLADLRTRTTENLALGRQLLEAADQTLRRRPPDGGWNALECCAHVNCYGKFYLPEIRRRIEAAPADSATVTFSSSWLGNTFATSMKPGPKTRKIKAFRKTNPTHFATAPDRSDVAEFVRQQEEMLELLELAAGVDLTRTKTSISLTRLIKLRLGDTLRIVINHVWRHAEQAIRAAKIAPPAPGTQRIQDTPLAATPLRKPT